MVLVLLENRKIYGKKRVGKKTFLVQFIKTDESIKEIWRGKRRLRQSYKSKCELCFPIAFQQGDLLLNDIRIDT